MNSQTRVDTVEAMLDFIVRSKLRTEARAQDLLSQFKNEYLPCADIPEPVTAFCSFLVGQNILTTWQCEKLRNGQWKGFFDLDGYEMLDKLGTDESFGYYLARRPSDGAVVRLAITPRSKSTGGRIEYRVEEVHYKSPEKP